MTAIERLHGLVETVAIKAPCLVATSAPITLSGLQTVDGVVLAQGDRVLVRAQTDPIQNGIYAADTGTWQRDVDFNGTRDVVQGTVVLVASGTGNGATMWQLTTEDPVIGTSELNFTTVLASITGSIRDVAGLEGTVVDAALQRIYVSVYDASNPDRGGGAFWDKLAAPPSPVMPWNAQSLDGAWWEVSRHGQIVDPSMYGYTLTNFTTTPTIAITPADPWGTIVSDMSYAFKTSIVNFANGIDASGFDSGGYTWPSTIDIGHGEINLTAVQAGQVDINANFFVRNAGRVRAGGLHFILYATDGPQDDVWTIGNCTLDLINCTGKNNGAPGALVQSTRDGDAKIDIDPGNDNRENLYDWFACTGTDVLIGEGNIDLFIRAGKVTGQSYRYRVVIKAPPSTRGAAYVLRGRIYARSFLFIGAGSGNGLALVRGATGFIHPYLVGTPDPLITSFRDPGYIYPDDLRVGCVGFEKAISLRSNATLSITSDDIDDIFSTQGIFVFATNRAYYLSAGEIDFAPASVDTSGAALETLRDSFRVARTEHALAMYETTDSAKPSAAISTGAIIKITDIETPGSLWQTTGLAWVPLNYTPATGGTGILSYTRGDLLYASTVTTLAKLAAVASGSVLASTGVGSPPAWTPVWAMAGLANLVDTASILVNMAGGQNFQLTLTGNHTLSNPTGATLGQAGMILVTQDSTGGRLLGYDSAYKSEGGISPVLSTATGATDALNYFVRTTSDILVWIGKDFK